MTSFQYQKSQYILIDTVADLDPRKINIRDLNKKYMDRDGNRYALRFDLASRQVQVVRLAGSRDEATRIRQEVLKHRSGQDTPFYVESQIESTSDDILKETPLPNSPISSAPIQTQGTIQGTILSEPKVDFKDATGTGFSDGFREPGERTINAIDLFPELEREITRITDSQKAILKVMNRLSVIPELGDGEAFGALVKKIDDECIQGGLESIRLYQELNSYPKAALHYLANFPEAEKNRIEALSSEALQMKAIKKFELHRSYNKTLKRILELTIELRGWVDRLPDSEKSKPYVQDLIPSFSEIVSKATSLHHNLNEWYANSHDSI